MGFALALNCIAASLGMGLSSVSALGLGLSIALCSYAAVGLGNAYGVRIGCIGGRALDVVAGAILILIAVWELVI